MAVGSIVHSVVVRQLMIASMACLLSHLEGSIEPLATSAIASGVPLDEVFSAEMLRGGYRKKYYRAISRLVALAREGAGLSE